MCLCTSMEQVRSVTLHETFVKFLRIGVDLKSAAGMCFHIESMVALIHGGSK